MTRQRGEWADILKVAADLVESFDVRVTLRQLFYLLVSRGLIANSVGSYKALSDQTARARRAGWFPPLLDQTRHVQRARTFESPEAARLWLASIYRRDRTDGQERAIFLGCEKHTLLPQLWEWFADLGFPILPLGGYASQTYKDEVSALCGGDARPTLLLYVGDFDPSGEDIERDFVERVGFDEVQRVAVRPEHVEQYNLTPFPGKASDARAEMFVRRHGALVQVEVEALSPTDLHDLLDAAIRPHLDTRPLMSVVWHGRPRSGRVWKKGTEHASH